MIVRILMLGDIVGKVGRDAVQTMLPTLHDLYSPHFVIVNGENAAAGLGITPEIARHLLEAGVDVITLGNHTWSRREAAPAAAREFSGRNARQRVWRLFLPWQHSSHRGCQLDGPHVYESAG